MLAALQYIQKLFVTIVAWQRRRRLRQRLQRPRRPAVVGKAAAAEISEEGRRRKGEEREEVAVEIAIPCSSYFFRTISAGHWRPPGSSGSNSVASVPLATATMYPTPIKVNE